MLTDINMHCVLGQPLQFFLLIMFQLLDGRVSDTVLKQELALENSNFLQSLVYIVLSPCIHVQYDTLLWRI